MEEFKLKINHTQIDTNFTKTPNEIINSSVLSWKAKSLWTYIASKPEGWRFAEGRISCQARDGIDSTRTGLEELRAFGLLEREISKDSKGHRRVEYSILLPSEIPDKDKRAMWKSLKKCVRVNITKHDTGEWEIKGIYKSGNSYTWNTHTGKIQVWKTQRYSNKDSIKKEYNNNIIIYNNKESDDSLPTKKEYGNPQVNRAFEIWKEVLGFAIEPVGRERQYAWNIMRNKHKGEDWLIGKLKALKKAQQDPEFKYSGVKIRGFIDLHYNSSKLDGWLNEKRLSEQGGATTNGNFISRQKSYDDDDESGEGGVFDINCF